MAQCNRIVSSSGHLGARRALLWFAAMLALVLCVAPAAAQTRLRIVAGNITSGNGQSYDPGDGTRIFQGLRPDIALVQEFNYGTNSTADIGTWVRTAFGPEYSYYREGGAQIPNGIVSRYPIIASGEWDDPEVTNRDFAWARIDIPGATDLWAISVHLLTANATTRNAEAVALRNFINANVPAGSYLVIGGDFNTDNRSESCLSTFSSLVQTGSPYPADASNNGNTNASRSKPYDWVLASANLHALRTPVLVGTTSFANGLVYDSRVYSTLADVTPSVSGDSGSSNMQHMAVVRDFIIPADTKAVAKNGALPKRSVITPLQLSNQTIGTGIMKDYVVTIPAGVSRMIIFTSGSGNANLYVRKGAPPTRSVFDFSSTGASTNEAIVVHSLTTPSLSAGQWYITLYGSSASTANVVVKCQ